MGGSGGSGAPSPWLMNLENKDGCEFFDGKACKAYKASRGFLTKNTRLVNLQGAGGGRLMNLQQYQQAASTPQSQYVPFGPSAGEGWRTDLGDSITDTAIIGNTAYNSYA